ncbi:hypothetical protein BaRGS_00027455 [Batillaria attramentaria]|uniref:Mitochondrial mRNA-processing protein COX24 C-terminal domain-containing protein n=1 Tax=Batillaria attramentaria TaxID=370345 RepID=A0ABD0K2W4_9CAEN
MECTRSACVRACFKSAPVKSLFCALAGTRGRLGAQRQLVHTLDATPPLTPPMAHKAAVATKHEPSRLPALDLSIKTEPRDAGFPLHVFPGGHAEQELDSDSSASAFQIDNMFDDARVKAKEKSRQYREKQKLHRMTDSQYDMIFRQRVAERKRRQRFRDKMKKLQYGLMNASRCSKTDSA